MRHGANQGGDYYPATQSRRALERGVACAAIVLVVVALWSGAVRAQESEPRHPDGWGAAAFGHCGRGDIRIAEHARLDGSDDARSSHLAGLKLLPPEVSGVAGEPLEFNGTDVLVEAVVPTSADAAVPFDADEEYLSEPDSSDEATDAAVGDDDTSTNVAEPRSVEQTLTAVTNDGDRVELTYLIEMTGREASISLAQVASYCSRSGQSIPVATPSTLPSVVPTESASPTTSATESVAPSKTPTPETDLGGERE